MLIRSQDPLPQSPSTKLSGIIYKFFFMEKERKTGHCATNNDAIPLLPKRTPRNFSLGLFFKPWWPYFRKYQYVQIRFETQEIVRPTCTIASMPKSTELTTKERKGKIRLEWLFVCLFVVMILIVLTSLFHREKKTKTLSRGSFKTHTRSP